MQVVAAPSRLAIENVLFLTDFSPSSEVALAHAMAVAGRYRAQLLVTHIIPPPPQLEIPMDALPEFDFERQKAEMEMQAFLAGDPLAGFKHEVVIEQGDFEPALRDVAARHRVDLIVLGTHGRTGARKLVIGSVAEEVLRIAPCPVLTIGPEVSGEVSVQGKLEMVLMATDFSSSAIHALPYACAVAQENKARLALLNVIPDELEPAERDRKRHEITEQIYDMLPVGILSACQAEALIEFGDPADAIVDVSRRLPADLLVMGAHASRHARLSSHRPWTTASRVLAHAPCPVLTVNR